VTRIVNMAGVKTLWAAPGEALPQLANMWIYVLPRSVSSHLTLTSAVPKNALEFTPGAGPDRDLAYIFYSNFEAVPMTYQSSQVDRAKIVGCVISHEIGHLLLNAPSHSPAGILRPTWDRWAMLYAGYGQLLFTRQQAKLIRRAVDRRRQALGLLQIGSY
jgi:hypothetical protein